MMGRGLSVVEYMDICTRTVLYNDGITSTYQMTLLAQCVAELIKILIDFSCTYE